MPESVPKRDHSVSAKRDSVSRGPLTMKYVPICQGHAKKFCKRAERRRLWNFAKALNLSSPVSTLPLQVGELAGRYLCVVRYPHPHRDRP